jgi:hypothetical protein
MRNQDRRPMTGPLVDGAHIGSLNRNENRRSRCEGTRIGRLQVERTGRSRRATGIPKVGGIGEQASSGEFRGNSSDPHKKLARAIPQKSHKLSNSCVGVFEGQAAGHRIGLVPGPNREDLADGRMTRKTESRLFITRRSQVQILPPPPMYVV